VKTALSIFAGLIVVAVAAALILPGFIDWNEYKGDITAEAHKATGRTLTINGDISLTVLPSPALKVADIHLANAPGGTAKNMVSLQALEVDVALWPLLSGELQVQSVHLIEPVIALEIDKAGKPNWDFSAAASNAGAASTSDSAAGQTPAFRLDSLVIENGTLTFNDASSGLSERIDALTAEVSARSLDGPFDAKGKVTSHGLPLGFDLALGRLTPGVALPLSLDLVVGKETGSISLRGNLSRPDVSGEFTGRIEISGADAQALVRVLSTAANAPVAELAGLKQAISLHSDVSADAGVVGLNNLALKLGEMTATGAINAVLGDAPRIDAALDVNRIDLDAWMAAAAGEADKPDPASAAATPATGENKAAPFVIPPDLSGAVALNVNALTYKGASIREFTASAALAGGVVTIEKIAAHLPGGAAVDVVGTVAAVDGLPLFEGGLRASADNLRGFLTWMGVDLSAVPQDRLRGASLAATVRSTPELAEVYGIDLRLDSSTLTGGAAYAFRERPAFSVDFAVDQLNLDAYRMALSGSAAPSSDKVATAKPATSPGLELTALPPEVVEVLNAFDTNIKVAIKKLNLNAVPVRGVVVDVGLLGGAVTVNDIHADDLGGATFSFQGKALDLGGKPTLSGVIDVQAANASGLARLADVVLPVPAERLGAVRAMGKVDGSAGRLGLDLTVSAARTTTRLTGDVDLTGAATRFNLAIQAGNQSYVGLWRVFDPKFSPAPGGKDGALGLTGTLVGDPAALGVDLKIGFADARLTVAGKLSPGGAPNDKRPSYNLAIKAEHPDAPAFLRGLGVDYQPATSNLGKLTLAADVAGNTGLARIANIDAHFGPLALSGSAATEFDGPRPRIEASLVTSEILVDLFLPRGQADGTSSGSGTKKTGSSSGASNGRDARWSDETINLDLLNSVDLDLDLGAPAITAGVYRFVNPVVKATIKDGVLDINPLTGKLFGGDVQLTARVLDNQAPTVDMNISLNGADIQQTLVTAAGVDVVTGLAAFNGQFRAFGHSQKAMVSQLSGRADFSAQNGIVTGIDLQKLSDRLKRLDRTMDFLSLINTTMKGGQTAYSRLGGTFAVQNGVARSNDLSATMQAGSGAGRAVIDLPRWLIDMTGEFRLTEHPQAPPVGLELRGPLDAPQRDIKSSRLEGFVAQRVGGTVIRKFLGKKKGGLGKLGDLITGGGSSQSQQPAPQPAPQQPAPQQQPSAQTAPGSPPPPTPLLPQQPAQQPQQQPGKVKPEDLFKSFLKKKLGQ